MIAYRDRLEIVRQILQVCVRPSGSFRLMYSANLSFDQTKTYKQTLIASLLLSKTGKQFVTTDKGREFLARCDELDRLGLAEINKSFARYK